MATSGNIINITSKPSQKCYYAELLSPTELKDIYTPKNGSLDPKVANEILDHFTIESLNISPIHNALKAAIQLMTLLIPCDIIDLILELSLNESQTYIQHKSKQIHSNINNNTLFKNNKNMHFPLNICREICLYSGSYCWDGLFWCIMPRYYGNAQYVPLHKYTSMDRVLFYCGNRDVIYSKSDEFCYGSRYYVEIKIDSKNDEMWLGIIFKDIINWSDYRRESNQIAYYGGRRRRIAELKNEFQKKFPNKFQQLSNDNNDNKTIDFELNMIKNKAQLTAVVQMDYYWDSAFGSIHGRSEVQSDFLPYYESGDIVGILVDTKNGFVYFFKNSNLVWYNNDKDIINSKCKIFGSTDYKRDTLIYQRILWNKYREKKLKQQTVELRKIRPNIDDFSIVPRLK